MRRSDIYAMLGTRRPVLMLLLPPLILAAVWAKIALWNDQNVESSVTSKTDGWPASGNLSVDAFLLDEYMTALGHILGFELKLILCVLAINIVQGLVDRQRQTERKGAFMPVWKFALLPTIVTLLVIALPAVDALTDTSSYGFYEQTASVFTLRVASVVTWIMSMFSIGFFALSVLQTVAVVLISLASWPTFETPNADAGATNSK